MKTIKFILCILTLAALAVGAQAQGLVTMTGGSFNIAASATSNANFSASYVIDCRRQQNVAVEWTMLTAGSTLCGLRFVPSLDGTIAAATPGDGFTLALAPTANTLTYAVTNLNCKGYNYLLLFAATNGGASTLTNTIRYYVKPSAP